QIVPMSPAFPPKSIGVRGLTTVFVLLPLLIAVRAGLSHLWKASFRATAFLVMTAAFCMVLTGAIHIKYWSNEYKFIFVASMSLAPMAALATERFLLHQRISLQVAAVALLYAALAGPQFPHLWRWSSKAQPREFAVDASEYYIALPSAHPLSAICRAIRERSPSNSILMTLNSELHFPTFTARP